ncbi:MAG TPA: hypothetical protein VFP68_08940, partial [Burkholderiaceae bacterium]|nr:hypothetical protein [Burkholderiaceae bacterium]
MLILVTGYGNKIAYAKIDNAGRKLSARLGRARQAEAKARQLAADVKTLTDRLGHDVLSLAGSE